LKRLEIEEPELQTQSKKTEAVTGLMQDEEQRLLEEPELHQRSL